MINIKFIFTIPILLLLLWHKNALSDPTVFWGNPVRYSYQNKVVTLNLGIEVQPSSPTVFDTNGDLITSMFQVESAQIDAINAGPSTTIRVMASPIHMIASCSYIYGGGNNDFFPANIDVTYTSHQNVASSLTPLSTFQISQGHTQLRNIPLSKTGGPSYQPILLLSKFSINVFVSPRASGGYLYINGTSAPYTLVGTDYDYHNGAITAQICDRAPADYNYYPNYWKQVPTGLYPVIPFKIHYRVELPLQPKLVIRALEPYGALNMDTLLNSQQAKVRFYVQNGTAPASSVGLNPSNTSSPVTINGQSAFDLDSMEVKAFNFSVGRLYFKNFTTPLQIDVNPANQYVVGQFIFDNDESKKSAYFLASDLFVSYLNTSPPSTDYQWTAPTDQNSLTVLLTSIAKKAALYFQK